MVVVSPQQCFRRCRGDTEVSTCGSRSWCVVRMIVSVPVCGHVTSSNEHGNLLLLPTRRRRSGTITVMSMAWHWHDHPSTRCHNRCQGDNDAGVDHHVTRVTTTNSIPPSQHSTPSTTMTQWHDHHYHEHDCDTVGTTTTTTTPLTTTTATQCHNHRYDNNDARVV